MEGQSMVGPVVTSLCRIAVRIMAGSILLFLFACSSLNQTRELPASVKKDIPRFPSGNSISVKLTDRSRFITNLLGPEYLAFASNTDFYWTKMTANDVILDLNKRLPDAMWLLETDWGHQNALILSSWKKGDLELSILLFDDLDSVAISGLSKNYGISGPVPGSTMLVMHVIDKAVPSVEN